MLGSCTSPKEIVVDSFCYTYDYIELPEELLIAVKEGQEVEEWVLDTIDNNDYYNEVCK